MEDTTATSAEYQGSPGHTYAFYSIATDNVRNVQPTPTAAQATTTVVLAPVVSGGADSVDEDAALTVSAPGPLADDSDPYGDPLSAVLVSGPADGVLRFNPNGSFVYTPNSGFFGTDTFTYAAEDTTLSVSSQPATVTITVNEVNQAPTISAPATAIVNEGGKLVFSAAQGDAISAADADSNGQPEQLTLIVTNGMLTLPSTSGLSFIQGSNGSASMTVQGSVASSTAP